MRTLLHRGGMYGAQRGRLLRGDFAIGARQTAVAAGFLRLDYEVVSSDPFEHVFFALLDRKQFE